MKNLAKIFFALCLLLLVGSRAWAAAPLNTAAVTSADHVGDKSEAFDAGTGSNRILILGCVIDTGGDVDTITGATYNSVALSNLIKIANLVGAKSELWYLLDPATGSNTIAVDSSNNAQEAACGYLVYSGVDQTTPFTGTTTNTDATSPFDITAECPAGNVAIDVIGSGAAAITFVVDGGQTQRALANEYASGAGSFGMSEEAGAGSTTMNWTATTNTTTARIATCLMAVAAPATKKKPAPIFFQ